LIFIYIYIDICYERRHDLPSTYPHSGGTSLGNFHGQPGVPGQQQQPVVEAMSPKLLAHCEKQLGAFSMELEQSHDNPVVPAVPPLGGKKQAVAPDALGPYRQLASPVGLVPV
jgi:hypothetical protein